MKSKQERSRVLLSVLGGIYHEKIGYILAVISNSFYSLRKNATNAGVTHYPDMLWESAAHDHGYAGEVMWPYSILCYDETEDRYHRAYDIFTEGPNIELCK